MDTFAVSLPRQREGIGELLPDQRHIFLIISWFIISLISLVFLFVLFYYTTHLKIYAHKNQDFKFYTAVPVSQVVVQDSISASDGRAKIIENFFKGHKAVLANYGEDFVRVADKYQLDYRLLPAIAMQESNGGKRVIKNSNNPFGFGIYGSKVIRFDSWEEAIETVGAALREDYLNQGFKNPYQIMTKYTPPSLEKGGTWAIGVTQFMEELK